MMDVLENPCVAQCIAKHIGKGSTNGSERVASLLAFAAISNDARFHEAIEPEIRAAQYLNWLIDWAENLKNYSTSMRKETEIIIANRDIVKLRECIQTVDKNMCLQMKEMCAFARRHQETARRSEEVKSMLNHVFHDLIVNQSARLSEFHDEGCLFVEEMFKNKKHR
jgi:tetraacyldisaccharide-1-P 4'-kinase